MLKTVQMWSDQENAVVEWVVAVEIEDSGSRAIVARHKDEFHSFSPSTTDAELENLAANIQHGVSAGVQEQLNG